MGFKSLLELMDYLFWPLLFFTIGFASMLMLGEYWKLLLKKPSSSDDKCDDNQQ